MIIHSTEHFHWLNYDRTACSHENSEGMMVLNGADVVWAMLTSISAPLCHSDLPARARPAPARATYSDDGVYLLLGKQIWAFLIHADSKQLKACMQGIGQNVLTGTNPSAGHAMLP